MFYNQNGVPTKMLFKNCFGPDRIYRHSPATWYSVVICMILLSPMKTIAREKMSPGQIFVTGKILNYSQFNNIKTIALIYNNSPIMTQVTAVSNIADDGGFTFSLCRPSAQDVMIDFLTIFRIFVSPGDSIHIEFLASYNSMDVYRNIKFSGSRIRDNINIAKFNHYFTGTQSSWALQTKKQTQYSPEKYTSFLDSVRNSLLNYYGKFIVQNSVSDTAQAWIYASIQQDFLYHLADYPDNHLKYNRLNKGEWFVNNSYFDPFVNIEFSELMLLNTDISTWYVGLYLNNVISYMTQKSLFEKGIGKYEKQGKYDAFVTFYNDSIPKSPSEQFEREIKPILDYTHDNIIRQLIFCKKMSDEISYRGIEYLNDKSRMNIFDKYVTNKNIRDQFLNYHYGEDVNTDIEHKNVNLIKNETLKDILKTNYGKVIYIDFWATWCGPCIHEMPYLNNLIEKYKTKDIVFVSMCIDSPKDIWQRIRTKKEAKGLHYWSDKDQSNEVRAEYGIDGIPFYILITKDGKVQFKGSSNLRPSEIGTTNQLDKLLQ